MTMIALHIAPIGRDLDMRESDPIYGDSEPTHREYNDQGSDTYMACG